MIQVRIFPDLEALSRAAAESFVTSARQCLRASGRFSVALAGGTTPRSLHTVLASEPYRSRIPWDGVHVFWGDERCVPPDHPESNFFMARQTLLAQVPIPSSNIHRIPADHGDPDAAAVAYEGMLNAWFHLQHAAVPAFDLVFLGLGTDGHTAALFPHSRALDETRRLVTTAMGTRPRLPRVTVTIPVLTHAKRLIWLVAGQEKAAVVRAVLSGPGRVGALPAQQVHATDATIVWLIDEAAARLLRRRRGDAVSHDPGW